MSWLVHGSHVTYKIANSLIYTVNPFILVEPKVSETEVYSYVAECYISSLQDA